MSNDTLTTDNATNTGPVDAPKQEAQETSLQSELKDFLAFLIKLLIVILVFRSFIFSAFNIPSESMQPRLLIGDYLFVSKWPYGYSQYSLPFSVPLISGKLFATMPERGDVVVFKAPPRNHQDYIKRAIGLPGDTISMRGGQVILNGVAISRTRIADFVTPVTDNMLRAAENDGAISACYLPLYEERTQGGKLQCRYPQYLETLPNGKTYKTLDLGEFAADDFGPVIVPENHIFVMGDNRDRSQDSRFAAVYNGGVGMVPQANLVGRASFTVFSTDGSASWVKPWTWFTAARWERIGETF